MEINLLLTVKAMMGINLFLKVKMCLWRSINLKKLERINVDMKRYRSMNLTKIERNDRIIMQTLLIAMINWKKIHMKKNKNIMNKPIE